MILGLQSERPSRFWERAPLLQLSRFRFATVCTLAFGVSLGLAAGASADQPGGPKITSGSAQVGATLSSDKGALYCQPACTHTLEWLSCTGPSAGGAYLPADAPNARASGCEIRWARPAPPTYTVGRDDQGRYIQVHVFVETVSCDEEDNCTAFYEEGYSPTVGPIAAAPAPPDPVTLVPQNTARPAISGKAEDMQTLAINPGVWTGTIPIAFRYQWQRCQTGPEDCKPIVNAVGPNYKVRRGDIGSRITATVTAVNPFGSASLAANPTSSVRRASPRPGHDVLEVSELHPADGLLVKSIEGPRVVRSRSGVLLRVTITDRRGFLIDGAIVKAAGGAVVAVKSTSGARGVAYLEITLGRHAVAPSRMALTITASKPGVKSLRATKRIVLRVVAL
jgi:hypothetical protein